jgi:hypothetical protein
MDGQAQYGALTGAIGPVRAPSWGSQSGDERSWQYAEVACRRCEAVVGVTKFSLQHTSVQWTGEAVLTCAEFRVRALAGEPTALVATCISLRDSIDAAVAEGAVLAQPP